MPLFTTVLTNIPKVKHLSLVRRNLTGGRIIFNKSKAPKAASASSSEPSVQGLSENVVKVPNEPVGPGASKSSNYPNPEYFCYDRVSYYEAEVEMAKYRCPQPSVFRPYQHSNPK